MPRSVKVTLAAFAALLCVYLLLRVAFYVVNRAAFADADGAEVAMAFVRGVRFDAAALVLLNLPAAVLYHLPRVVSGRPWMRGFAFFVFAVANVFGLLVNLADLAYYPEVQRRLLWEPYRRPG
jgi:hypothetical protein